MSSVLYLGMRDRKTTAHLCIGKMVPCGEKAYWRLTREEDGRIVYACDEHLAAALRWCGLPARVDPIENTSVAGTRESD